MLIVIKMPTWWQSGGGALPTITGANGIDGPLLNQSFSFYAEDSTHIEFVLSGTAGSTSPSTIKFTKLDGSWIDGSPGDWPSQVAYGPTVVTLKTNSWTNQFVNPNYSSPYTAGSTNPPAPLADSSSSDDEEPSTGKKVSCNFW